MGFAVRVLPETLRTINSATFTGSYQALGTALSHNVLLVKITNNSTVGITVSWDGVNDHDFVPAGSFVLYDITANKPQQSPGLFIGKGTVFYVKAAAGVGTVYITTLYGVEQ